MGLLFKESSSDFIFRISVWSSWPPEVSVTPENMNYSILVTGFIIPFSIMYYFPGGMRSYIGPLIEREVKEIARAKE